MLFYVECGVEFTNMYGDINEAFYYSIESMFADFVRVLNSLDSEAYYIPIQKILFRCWEVGV